MKDYVREENCKFYIDQLARKVVCVYEPRDNAAVQSGLAELFDIFCNRQLYDSTRIPSRFVGIATCAEGDKWDESIGRRMAFLKMRKKYYRSYFKAINRSIDLMDTMIGHAADKFNVFGEKIQKSIDREEIRLEEMLREKTVL